MAVGPGNRAQVHGVVLGGAVWKALHPSGLITQYLLSSDAGSLALKPLRRTTPMPIPGEEVFLLLWAQKSPLTCSFSACGCRIPSFQSALLS